MIPSNPSFGWRVAYIALTLILAYLIPVLMIEVHYCL